MSNTHEFAGSLRLILAVVGLSNCPGPSAFTATAAPVAVGSGAHSRVIVSTDAEKTADGYLIRLTSKQDGLEVERDTLVIPAEAVRRNMLPHLAPDRIDETLASIDNRMLERLGPLLDRRRDIERKLIEAYPACEDVPKSERRATFTVTTPAEPSDGGPPGASVNHCVVVPPQGAPEANALMALWSEMFKSAHDLDVVITEELAFDTVTLRPPPGPVTEPKKVIRPDYEGITRKAAIRFEAIGRFIRKSQEGGDERAIVEAALGLVQPAQVDPLDRRAMAYPSPEAVLVDARGPVDAKAVTLAALIHAALPEIHVALLEMGEAYLLGISLPAREGDMIVDDLWESVRGFVVLDPWAEAPVGQVVQPGLSEAMADRKVTAYEISKLYRLRKTP
ncbi:hypothetical protein [Thalassobaculum sp.]|uniref:hypothetical protein n=1 Tax=Thalassobaculum sp. TaxID=2022740 RepID=UPI0032EEE291